MTGPDRLFMHRDWLFTHGPASDPSRASQHDVEFVRRDPAVLAALPEVQALIRQAVEAEREACARLVDCGCDAAKKAAVLRAANGTELARACGEYACGADDAAAIRKRGEGQP